MKFTVIYQTLAVSSKGMKIRIRIWNKFKTKKEVLKINLITHADIGSPVSFWLLQRNKVWFSLSGVFLINWTQVKFHKETSCSLITGNLHYIKTVFHQNWFALQLVLHTTVYAPQISQLQCSLMQKNDQELGLHELWQTTQIKGLPIVAGGQERTLTFKPASALYKAISGKPWTGSLKESEVKTTGKKGRGKAHDRITLVDWPFWKGCHQEDQRAISCTEGAGWLLSHLLQQLGEGRSSNWGWVRKLKGIEL